MRFWVTLLSGEKAGVMGSDAVIENNRGASCGPLLRES